MPCPLCQKGMLTEWVAPSGEISIVCSEYPKCRFTAPSWAEISGTLAHFQHPVTREQV